jgi:SHS2 domain-containing protein
VERFRTLEHTADVGFEAFGSTREEVFISAALALLNLMVDLDSVRPCEQVRIQVEGRDLPSLLVNWLSEILYRQDAEGWLFREFELQNLTERSLSATARGERLDRPRHALKLLVKAITYHQLCLEPTLKGWRAQVYVDI